MGTKGLKLGGRHNFLTPTKKLSQRQMDILNMLKLGYGDKQIGYALGVHTSTIKNQNTTIFNKLGVDNRVLAVTEGLKLGIISLDGSGDIDYGRTEYVEIKQRFLGISVQFRISFLR